MKEFRIVHPCDHNINTTKKVYTVLKLEKRLPSTKKGAVAVYHLPSQYKLINNTHAFSKKSETYEDDTEMMFHSPEDINKYYKEIDYFIDLNNNLIEWNASSEGVNAPNFLFIEGTFFETQSFLYDAKDCPRCNGVGWFNDIMNKISRDVSVTGLEKLTQNIIKILFTLRYDNYGTLLDSAVKKIFNNPEDYFNLVSEMILTSESEYKQLQQRASFYSKIPDAERLDKIEIVSSAFIKETGTLKIILRVHSMNGEHTNFNFDL